MPELDASNIIKIIELIAQVRESVGALNSSVAHLDAEISKIYTRLSAGADRMEEIEIALDKAMEKIGRVDCSKCAGNVPVTITPAKPEPRFKFIFESEFWKLLSKVLIFIAAAKVGYEGVLRLLQSK